MIVALLILAAWRITHLITDDEVPFGTLRTAVEKKFPTYGWGLACTFCMSVWTGAAFAVAARFIFPHHPWYVYVLAAPALSTTTIVIESVLIALPDDS